MVDTERPVGVRVKYLEEEVAQLKQVSVEVRDILSKVDTMSTNNRSDIGDILAQFREGGFNDKQHAQLDKEKAERAIEAELRWDSIQASLDMFRERLDKAECKPAQCKSELDAFKHVTAQNSEAIQRVVQQQMAADLSINELSGSCANLDKQVHGLVSVTEEMSKMLLVASDSINKLGKVVQAREKEITDLKSKAVSYLKVAGVAGGIVATGIIGLAIGRKK
jgi:chromosome segregation ATPase